MVRYWQRALWPNASVKQAYSVPYFTKYGLSWSRQALLGGANFYLYLTQSAWLVCHHKRRCRLCAVIHESWRTGWPSSAQPDRPNWQTEASKGPFQSIVGPLEAFCYRNNVRHSGSFLKERHKSLLHPLHSYTNNSIGSKKPCAKYHNQTVYNMLLWEFIDNSTLFYTCSISFWQYLPEFLFQTSFAIGL